MWFLLCDQTKGRSIYDPHHLSRLSLISEEGSEEYNMILQFLFWVMRCGLVYGVMYILCASYFASLHLCSLLFGVQVMADKTSNWTYWNANNLLSEPVICMFNQSKRNITYLLFSFWWINVVLNLQNTAGKLFHHESVLLWESIVSAVNACYNLSESFLKRTLLSVQY